MTLRYQPVCRIQRQISPTFTDEILAGSTRGARPTEGETVVERLLVVESHGLDHASQPDEIKSVATLLENRLRAVRRFLHENF